jgi:hypothetical protein
MKIKTKQVIDVDEWDKLITETYRRPYNLQQQNDCMNRGNLHFKVPDEADDFEDETVPEEVNSPKMGVSFAAWLARDPKQPIKDQKYDFELELWWDRNFYPSFQMVANDLHKKGLLAAGEYTINIDW